MEVELFGRHDIYKWHAEKRKARARALSFAGPSQVPEPAFEHIHEPGGFRRNYVLMRASEQGATDSPPILRNFIDFLYLFGHFVGSLHSYPAHHFLTMVLHRLEKI